MRMVARVQDLMHAVRVLLPYFFFEVKTVRLRALEHSAHSMNMTELVTKENTGEK